MDANPTNSIITESGIDHLICTCPTPEMVPAGTLVHLLPAKARNGNKYQSPQRKPNEDPDNRYMLRVIENVEEFLEIKISPNLLKDHFAQAYVEGLRDVTNYCTHESPTQ